MFENAGKKIKTLALIQFCLVALGSIYYAGEAKGVVALIVFVGGILVGWVMTLGLYAFGELCENVHEINEKMHSTQNPYAPYPIVGNHPMAVSSGSAVGHPWEQTTPGTQRIINCPSCGRPTDGNATYCVHCGNVLR